MGLPLGWKYAQEKRVSARTRRGSRRAYSLSSLAVGTFRAEADEIVGAGYPSDVLFQTVRPTRTESTSIILAFTALLARGFVSVQTFLAVVAESKRRKHPALGHLAHVVFVQVIACCV